jgi:transposase
MPRAYSPDLRERVLLACEQGGASQGEIARRFQIGERTISGWPQAARTGRRTAKPRAGGLPLLGGAAEALAKLVAEQNDATLAECADRLAERTGVRRSLAAVCRALQVLRLRRKEKRSGPPRSSVRPSSSNGWRGAPSWQGPSWQGLSQAA